MLRSAAGKYQLLLFCSQNPSSKQFIIIICFVAVPLGVNYAFRHETPVDILAARWEASDALNYIATTLAFIGTFFLGLVAWKQNTDLQDIETNMFIANNSCEVFLESIQLKSLNQMA